EDDRVVLGERAPDVRLVELRTDVERVVIPEHLDPRAEARPGLGVALDVHERLRPRDGLPGGLIERAVDRDRARGPIADVAPGIDRPLRTAVSGVPGLPRGGAEHHQQAEGPGRSSDRLRTSWPSHV